MAALSAYLHEAIKALAADPKAAAATVTGGVGAYAGLTAMTYNKANFMIDQGNRFGRFAAARANMVAQVGQYRFDIRGMANITVTKCHVFLDTAQLFMCTSAACSCAGRIGMHGSAPPGWLCALYTGNIFIGAMYLTICMWLGFHATLRAQCGMVSLLTRKVRLPIPSLAMINQSRQFGSGYEKQRWWDIMRFPWVPHPFDGPEIPGASSEEDEAGDGKASKGKKKKAKREVHTEGDYASSDAFGSTGRTTVPSWIHDEQVTDKGTAGVPIHTPKFRGDIQLHNSSDPHDAPDHFKLFTEAQKEWFPYEVYHKIALLYGACCFMHTICYYCVITAMSELRGFWIAWAIPGVLMTAQYWLLQLDIFKANGSQYLRGFEIFGQLAPYFAAAACQCEFRFQYSKAQVGLAWTFAICSLASHMLFAMRFWDLMSPDTFETEMEDKDGKSWWPKSWPVPLAFAGTLWQLAPPKKLKKGQHDLLHEALNLERQNGGVCKVRRRRGKDSGNQKRTKRATPQNPKALMHQVRELDDRFRSIWQHVPGKDQMHLNQLYGRWHSANKDAQALHGNTMDTDASAGSGSEGSSDGYATYVNSKNGDMRHNQYNDKITDVADELNHIEDTLADMEKTHSVSSDGAKPAEAGMSLGVESGTSTRGLPQTPYWLMRAAVGTHIFIWAFVIVCTCIEITLGSESLFIPPGEPPWIRNQKMRPYQPDKSYLHLSSDPKPDWYRLFVAATIPAATSHGDAAGGHGAPAAGHSPAPAAAGMAPAAGNSPAPAADAHAGGGHRRLEEMEAGAFGKLFSTLPALNYLAEKYLKDDDRPSWEHTAMATPTGTYAGMPTTMPTSEEGHAETTSVPMGGFMTPTLRTLPVEWPPLFEPRHIACQTRASGAVVAALTSRGFGALLHVKNSSETANGQTMTAEQFALSGISALGALVGASWSKSGLHLVTKAGHLLHCPGHTPTDGVWACQPDAGAPVPMTPGSMLTAGAVHEHATHGRTLALLHEDMPTTVVIYKEDVAGKAWRPAGEMHLPPGSRRATLGFASDALIMAAEDGAVHHRPLYEDGSVPSFIAAPASSVAREWHSACSASAGEGGVVRLALRQGGHATAAWRPELVVEVKIGTTTPVVGLGKPGSPSQEV